MTRTTLRAIGALVILAGVVSCSDEPASPPAPPPEVGLGLTQLLPEEGTDRALLRVLNRESDPIEVTAVGLAWEGYGDVLQPTDDVKVVPAESELMLRLQLPAPRCPPDGQAPGEPIEGRLTVDGVDVTQPLTDAAQVYVRRLWRTQCDQQLLERQLRVEYADRPRQVSGPEGAAVRTALLLTRVDGNEPVRVTAAGGSVLYDVRLTGGTSLRADVRSTRIPLAVLPGDRCDEHAIGQATAPYDFTVTLDLGGRRVLHSVVPPLAIQRAASEMLLRHCR